MCWAFENCDGSQDMEVHDHCHACAEPITAKKADGTKQQVCIPQCEEDKILDEMEASYHSGPVSWCCICDGMGGKDGARCWGCQ